jgi:hypothetical protein
MRRQAYFASIFALVAGHALEAPAQSVLRNVVKIQVIDSLGEPHVGAGLVIGRRNRSVFVATAKHLFKYGRRSKNLLFYDDAGVEPFRPIGEVTPIDHLDLAFVEVDLHNEQLEFNELWLADKRALRPDTDVKCIGHPVADTGWTSTKSHIQAWGEGDSLLLAKLDLQERYSGGPVYEMRQGRLAGMVLESDAEALTVECLKMSVIHHLAGQARIPHDFLRPAPYIPRRVQVLKYTGLGLLAIAGIARIISDSQYRTYRRSGAELGAAGFEERYGKTLDRAYNQANFMNRAAYITAGGAILSLGISIGKYKNLNRPREFSVFQLFIRG